MYVGLTFICLIKAMFVSSCEKSNRFYNEPESVCRQTKQMEDSENRGTPENQIFCCQEENILSHCGILNGHAFFDLS